MPRSTSPKTELSRLLELLSPVDRRVMAQLWAASSPEPSVLAMVMLEQSRVQSIWDRLGVKEREALTRVLQDGGSISVAIMQREYGVVREPQGFAHPRAYLEALNGPATPTETLFSLGFLFRTHDQRGAIYRVPHDLLALLPDVPPRDRRLMVQPHVVDNHPRISSRLTDSAEDLVVTLLSLGYRGELTVLSDGALNKASLVKLARAIPSSPELQHIRRESDWPFVAFVRTMAVEATLLRRGAADRSEGELRPTPQALAWLQASRAQRTKQLLDAWCGSGVDELVVLCGLRWKGGAPYTLSRGATRRGLLQLMSSLPASEWLAVDGIISEIYRVEPDFQRRDGRYDTWLLYNHHDQLVSSWADWVLVEGALIQAILSGPLAWLGLVELDDADQFASITPLGAHLLSAAPPPPESAPSPLIVQSTFEVLCPPDASPYVVFQLGRFAERIQGGKLTIYKLTRSAMLAAMERGISADDVLAFLKQHSVGELPPAVTYSLMEWGKQAEQVRLEQAVLLHTADPVLLAQLRANKTLGLATAEALSATSLRVPDDATHELANRLRQAGFGLRDERIDPQLPLDEHDLKLLITAAFAYARVCNETELPCELSPQLLQRLAKLVPARIAEHARESAAAFAQQVINAANRT